MGITSASGNIRNMKHYRRGNGGKREILYINTATWLLILKLGGGGNRLCHVQLDSRRQT